MVRIVAGDIMTRLISKVDRTSDPDGCWHFTGALSGNNYGSIRVSGKSMSAHSLSYQIFCGEVPKGMFIDHLCHTRDNCSGGSSCPHRMCVRPSHLGLATPRENTLRGHGPCGDNIRKTHCLVGHELSADNIVIRPSTKPGASARECLICSRDRSRQYQRTKRAKNE